MSKPKRVHYYMGGYYDWAACGIIIPIEKDNYTTDIKKVTCENCLRKIRGEIK
jgi:hypothetical protein